MFDTLDTKCKCGGTFKEINIWEDIECDRCGTPTERYIYTPAEQASCDAAEAKREAEKLAKEEQKEYEEYLRLKAKFEKHEDFGGYQGEGFGPPNGPNYGYQGEY